MYTLETVQNRYKEGLRPKYIFFWGHTPKKTGVVGKSCFSQWFPISFTLDGATYPTAEHFMMAGKARLFEDDLQLANILQNGDPKAAKAFGRAVQNFDHELWAAKRFDIVVQGNFAKFSQNESLKHFLLATGDRVLVEASPYDKIWGIGMRQNERDVENPLLWRGDNLLGFALMVVRDRLRAAEA